MPLPYTHLRLNYLMPYTCAQSSLILFHAHLSRRFNAEPYRRLPWLLSCQLTRHTPRAVLFSGPTYGSLSLPDLYDDQGLGQLLLLVGHLKLGEDNGKLILSILSHMQLGSGSSRPFLSLPLSTYGRLLELNWITSIWSYTESAQVTIDIEHQWLQKLSREGDTMIIDTAMQFNLTMQQLHQINTCQMYLQVITISDISTADGTRLLPDIIKGKRIEDRVSNLQWPVTCRPTIWASWKLFLQHISSGGKLENQLGRWIDTPHQKRQWFYDPTLDNVYHQTNADLWLMYTNHSPTRTTRLRSCLYADPIPVSTPELTQCYPTTAQRTHDGIFSASSSLTFHIDIVPEEPQQWDLSIIPAPFTNTPHFFQRLIGKQPPTLHQCSTLAAAIENESLLSCSDGAYCPVTYRGSQSWLFGSVTDHSLRSERSWSNRWPSNLHVILQDRAGRYLGSLVYYPPYLRILCHSIRQGHIILR
jgi:hypothetical protein